VCVSVCVYPTSVAFGSSNCLQRLFVALTSLLSVAICFAMAGFYVALVLSLGLPASSFFAMPLGSHVLARAATDVHITSKFFTFDANLSYWLEGPIAPRISCIVATSKRILCPVNQTSEGDVVYNVRENVSGILHTVLIHFYNQPQVQNLSVAELPASGGAMFTLSFAGNGLVGADGVARFNDIKARFIKTCCIADPASCCDVLGEVPMDIVNGKYVSVQSRSPSLNVPVGTQVEVHLAMNGHSFRTTGKVVTVVPKGKLKIGFIYLSDPSDFGWTFQHNVGRLYLEETFVGQIETTTAEHVAGIGMNECEFCKKEPGWDNKANGGVGTWNTMQPGVFYTHRAANIIKKWVEEENVTMVFGCSFYYHHDLFHMAAKYPHVFFVHPGGWLTRRNMAVIWPKVIQTRYLSGIALGWYIKKHNLPKKVGFIAGVKNAQTARGVNALKLGLEMVDPQIDIYFAWPLSFIDPRKDDVAARRLIRYYDVSAIAQHLDMRAAQLAAKDEGKVGLGHNADMLVTVGDSTLTSPILVWGKMFADLVQKALDGNRDDFQSATWSGFEAGSTKLSSFSPRVPLEAKIMIAAEQAKLERGDDKIFCKPNMTDNKGRLRNNPKLPELQHLMHPGSTCLTDKAIFENCHAYAGSHCTEFWLLAGIHDHCGPSPRMPNGIRSPYLLPEQCFLGPVVLPNVCAPGEFLEITGCQKVRAGYYSRDEKEVPCGPGYYSNVAGMEACKPCSSGFYTDAFGASECTSCAPGRYAKDAAVSECMLCGPGVFSDKMAATQCSFCKQGTYSESEGAQNCTQCPAVMTTESVGKTSVNDCECPEGQYCVGSHPYCTCRSCPAGMTCPFGARALNLARPVPSGSRPQVLPGHYTTKNKPLSVYLCHPSRGKGNCPGGDPQVCNENLAGLTCASCEAGWFIKGDKCIKCDNQNAAVLVIAPLIGILICMVTYYTGNRQLEANSTVMLGCGCVFGLIVTVMQIFATFDQMTVPWPGGVKDFFGGAKFFVFNPSVLSAECMLGGSNPVNQYLVRFFLPTAVVVAMAVSYAFFAALDCLKMLPERLRWKLAKVINSTFQIYNAIFIALTAIAAAAFQCYSHPNGKSSLVQYPSVLCGSDDQNSIVAMSVVLLVTFVVPFIGVQVWANYYALRIRANLVQSKLHTTRVRFLMYRFRPDVWWWGIVLTIRQLLLGFAQMLKPDDPHAQCVFIITVLTIYIMGACFFWPWKTDELNLLDSVSMGLILIFVAASSSFIPKSSSSGDHGNFMVAVLSFVAIAAGFFTIYGAMLIRSKGKLNLLGAFGFDEQHLKTKEALVNMTRDLYKLCGSIQTASKQDLVEALLLMNSYDLRKVQGCIDVCKASTIASVAGESDRQPRQLLKVPHSSSANPSKLAEVKAKAFEVAESMGDVNTSCTILI